MILLKPGPSCANRRPQSVLLLARRPQTEDLCPPHSTTIKTQDLSLMSSSVLPDPGYRTVKRRLLALSRASIATSSFLQKILRFVSLIRMSQPRRHRPKMHGPSQSKGKTARCLKYQSRSVPTSLKYRTNFAPNFYPCFPSSKSGLTQMLPLRQNKKTAQNLTSLAKIHILRSYSFSAKPTSTSTARCGTTNQWQTGRWSDSLLLSV